MQATIAACAKELDDKRTAWLNPMEWTHEEILEFPGSIEGPWASHISDTDSRGIGRVRYRCLIPNSPDAAQQLSKRTLTNLYNERPTWLDHAHRKLDDAVLQAYGWPSSMSDEDILAHLLTLNQGGRFLYLLLRYMKTHRD